MFTGLSVTVLVVSVVLLTVVVFASPLLYVFSDEAEVLFASVDSAALVGSSETSVVIGSLSVVGSKALFSLAAERLYSVHHFQL